MSENTSDNVIQEALDYASGSNELENNVLSKEELEKIIEDIQSGKTDESFLYSVVELVRQKKEEGQPKIDGEASHGLRKR